MVVKQTGLICFSSNLFSERVLTISNRVMNKVTSTDGAYAEDCLEKSQYVIIAVDVCVSFHASPSIDHVTFVTHQSSLLYGQASRAISTG